MIRILARLALAGALIWLPLADASAAVVTITAKDAGGTSRTFNVTTTTDITGALSWNNVICDQATGSTCASVGTAGSPSTNALTVQALTLGHGTAANAMRVELPTDGTGVIATVSAVTAISNALPAGTNLMGKVGIDQTTVGTTNGVSLAQIGANAVSAGNGVSGTGVQRVAIASDNTAFSVNAVESGTWNITNISGTITLPTLAATSTKQSDGTQKSQIVDGSGNVIAATSNALNVQCANCSGSGVSTVDGAAFTAGTSVFVGIGGEFVSGGAGTCATTKQCMAGITTDRSIFVNLQDYAGTAISTSNPIPVQGIGVAQASTTAGQTGSPVMMGTTTAPRSDTTAQTNLLSGNLVGQLRTVGTSYPDGAVPLTASATGTTTATTATLAASASLKTYLCWFSIRANATAAATANSTVTGPVTGTLNFTQWTAPAASGIGLTEMIFNPCIPSSAINTAIAVISAAPGTGGVVSVSAGGYQAL